MNRKLSGHWEMIYPGRVIPAFSNFDYYYNGQEYVGPSQGSGTDWNQWGIIGSNLIGSIWGNNNLNSQAGNVNISGTSRMASQQTDSIPVWLIILIIGFVIALILL